MRKTISILGCTFLLLTGCKDQGVEEKVATKAIFSSIEKSELLVIHHDREGTLIHYFVPEGIPEEMVIRVTPTGENQDLYVTVLGSKRHKLLKSSLSISSKVGEGFLGKIDVIVENGLAVSINGNGFHNPALVSSETLRFIDEQLAKGKKASEGVSTIGILKD